MLIMRRQESTISAPPAEPAA